MLRRRTMAHMVSTTHTARQSRLYDKSRLLITVWLCAVHCWLFEGLIAI